MDWLLQLIDNVGGLALAGVIAAIVVIVIISMMDRHAGSKPPDPMAPPRPTDESPPKDK